MSLSFLISFMNFAYAQDTAKGEIIGKSTIYSFNGTRYEGEVTEKRIFFSEMSVDNTNTEEISLKNNEVIIGRYSLLILSNMVVEIKI